MIMFDLPVDTSQQRREYRHFRKMLINEGFVMMQFSIYVRVCPSRKSAAFLEQRLAKLSPPEGQIQSLIVTEAQYQSMTFISGAPVIDIRNSAERTIVL